MGWCWREECELQLKIVVAVEEWVLQRDGARGETQLHPQAHFQGVKSVEVGEVSEEGCSEVEDPLIGIRTFAALRAQLLVERARFGSAIGQAGGVGLFGLLLKLAVVGVGQSHQAHWIPYQTEIFTSLYHPNL